MALTPPEDVTYFCDAPPAAAAAAAAAPLEDRCGGGGGSSKLGRLDAAGRLEVSGGWEA